MTTRSLRPQELDGPRPVRHEELPASRRLTVLCFPGMAWEEEESSLYRCGGWVHPFHRHHRSRREELQVIVHRGVPVSQMGIYHSRINVYGCLVHVASIGGVCTDPGYRNQGLAARLLDYCIAKLTADGARLVLISGMRGLYARAGCVTGQDFEYIVLKSGQLRLRMDDLSIRPATETDVFPCARLYQAEAVHFVRHVEEFTEHFRRLEEFAKAEDWMVELAGRPVAYVLLSRPWECQDEPEARMREVVEYAGSRVALVGGLADVMARTALQEIRLSVPRQDVDLLQLLRARGITGERIPLFGHTMRVVNLPGLMSDLRVYVEGRLGTEHRAALAARNLRFEQEGDRCTIVCGQDRLELDAAMMTRLVMGIPAAEATDLPTGPGALGGTIIPALFPLPSFVPGLNYR